MNLSRREFSSVVAAALAAGFSLHANAASKTSNLYNLPKTGNVHLLHMTDCHAQLMPSYFREPSVNLGIGAMRGQLSHLVGEHLLKAAQIRSGIPEAHAFAYLNFKRAAKQYGRVGGFAHMAMLVKQLKASRRGALLLDGCCLLPADRGMSALIAKSRAPYEAKCLKSWRQRKALFIGAVTLTARLTN